MIDDAAEANLYNHLKHEREAVLAKLTGCPSTTSVVR